MRITAVAVALFSAGIALVPSAQAVDNATSNALVPVSVFTAKDIPEIEPGKPAWVTGATWSYGVAYYDKWLYAASQSDYILQFQRDPATAKLTYLGMSPVVGHHDTEKDSGYALRVRQLNDGSAMLTIGSGHHHHGFTWYAIDKNTGKLTPAGKQVPARYGHGHGVVLFLSDMQHICTDAHEKVDWLRYDEKGAPLYDGFTALKNQSADKTAGIVTFSPDGRYMYYLLFQDPKTDSKNGKSAQIDTYELDPKTHYGTYLSSVELPTPQFRAINGVLAGLDGNHLYAFVSDGVYGCNKSCYFELVRDLRSGAWTVAYQKAEPGLRNLDSPEFARVERFAFAGDGRRGYFLLEQRDGALGSFTRDPASGALTVLPPVADMGARKLVVDPVNGNLFTVGEKIASFKIPGSATASRAK